MDSLWICDRCLNKMLSDLTREPVKIGNLEQYNGRKWSAESSHERLCKADYSKGLDTWRDISTYFLSQTLALSSRTVCGHIKPVTTFHPLLPPQRSIFKLSMNNWLIWDGVGEGSKVPAIHVIGDKLTL